MSVYNGKDFLRESIDSILDQTYTDFEFIIIDDGSTDGTAEVLDSYKHPSIRVHAQKNQGLTKALNTAISLSRGEYLARQDADDVSKPERLGKQVTFLDGNEKVGLVGTYYNRIDLRGNILQDMKPLVRSDELKKRLESHNQFAHGSVMFRRRCIECVGIYREEFRVAQDYDLWLRISERFDVANLPEFLYQWRLNLSSQSVRSFDVQNDHASMASELAKERRSRGVDRLLELSPEERAAWTREFLESRLGDVRDGEAFGYNKWAKVFLDGGNHQEAIRFILRSLSVDPFRIDTWKLLFRASKWIAAR
jgi:glycosyltransferase involved in cell wall biosynthesis